MDEEKIEHAELPAQRNEMYSAVSRDGRDLAYSCLQLR